MPILSASAIAAHARNAGFTGTQIPVMVAIALAESGGNTTATHKNSDGSTDYGLWQINSVHGSLLTQGSWSNPADNAKMARAVFLSQGYGAWTTYKTGAYMRHMNGTAPATADANPGATVNASLLVPNPLAPLDALSSLANPHAWLRAAEFLAGAVLIILAIGKATGATQHVVSAAKTAAKTAAETAVLA